jgi:phosphate transport system permease protein
VSSGEHSPHTTQQAERRLARRYAAERRFRAYGIIAIGLALAALGGLLGSILWRGAPAFFQHELALEVTFGADVIDPAGSGDRNTLGTADYTALVRDALRRIFPEVTARPERRRLNQLLSSGAGYELRERVLADPDLIGRSEIVWLPFSDDADLFYKGALEAGPEARLDAEQAGWLRHLGDSGLVESRLSRRFLRSGDSREPELAGVWGAVVGSFLTLVITLAVAFPMGVAAAVHLQEFARRSRLTDFIEVNINNLAAVPSIVFGLLGLAVFLNAFRLPRSAPFVGGLVLALMTLPTIILAARSALAAVPPSIREAALGMGASPLQTVFHHVLPLAVPGILTGTIIGMARALGETAPLLMIGMVAFIVDVPGGFTSPATVLPVQVYLWADSPERAFVAKTSAAILVLLIFLVGMNLAAVVLRHRFERRW